MQLNQNILSNYPGLVGAHGFIMMITSQSLGLPVKQSSVPLFYYYVVNGCILYWVRELPALITIYATINNPGALKDGIV